MSNLTEDKEIGTIEFTVEDMRAIACLPLANLKPMLSVAQFEALSKFVHVNQITMGMNEGSATQ